LCGNDLQCTRRIENTLGRQLPICRDQGFLAGLDDCRRKSSMALLAYPVRFSPAKTGSDQL
jgi:hypothetical protein